MMVMSGHYSECSSGCPTGCQGRGDCGHRRVITIYTATAGAEYYNLYDKPRNPPCWGELNLSWGHGPRSPLVMRSVRIVSPLIRWMAKALIGGQK